MYQDVHKAWKTGCLTEQRRLKQADWLVPLIGALAIVTVRLVDGCEKVSPPVEAAVVPHVWQFAHSFLPEERRCLNEVAAVLKAHGASGTRSAIR